MQPECLAATNCARHADIVRRTISAIEGLRVAGERISFYSVAARAQVSRSTLYRAGDLRELVEAARVGGDLPLRVQPGIPDARIAALEDELARVSFERDELKRTLRDISPVHYALVQVAEAA